jgi:hypothetical protein
VTVPGNSGTTYRINGTVTNGPGISTQIGGDSEVRAVASPVDRFDEDNNNKITASELGGAVTAFGQNELTASELGEVVTAFGQS